MASSHGDHVMETASYILRSLGSNNARDMLRILSSFDDRFATISLDPASGGVSSFQDSRAVIETDLGGDENGRCAQHIILKWDFVSSETSRHSFIWTDHANEVPAYLGAVDCIQSLISRTEPISPTSSAILKQAQSLLQLAMLRLEEEFRNLMECHSESADPDVLFDITPGKEQSACASQHDVVDLTSKHIMEAPVDLLPPQVLSDLCNIATRMVNAGYEAECTQVYTNNRKAILAESLQRLGLTKLTIEEVHQMQWDVLEKEIAKWINIIKVGIGILFCSEKHLCEQIFKASSKVVNTVFSDIAKGYQTQLLNFCQSIAICRRAPEKLFKILDVYETLRDLLPFIEALFSSPDCTNLRLDASTILTCLADCARGTFAEFEYAVKREASRNAVPGGTVHPLTRYVMNYMRFLSLYTDTLNQLLSDRNLDQSSGSSHGSDNTERTPLSKVTIGLLSVLEANLDVKSKLYRDPALTFLFLMNNLHYIVQKAKDSEVRKLLGDEWIKRHSGKLHQYHNDYRRAAWSKLLSCLRDEGINVSSGSSSGASRNILKERFKNFNSAFEENLKVQSSWIVSDPQLCTELRISITEMIVPAYRAFLGRFQNHLDALKNSDRYIKYTPEDLETLSNELLEGSSASMNKRRLSSSISL